LLPELGELYRPCRLLPGCANLSPAGLFQQRQVGSVQMTSLPRVLGASVPIFQFL
jgi:hypothetical protein